MQVLMPPRRDSQVLIGTALSPTSIYTEDGNIFKVKGFSGRALWSWLRLQQGRKIDEEIKLAVAPYREKLENKKISFAEYKYELKKILKNMMETSLSENQRTIQYIIINGKVKAVASLKHLLIPPEEVMAVAQDILNERDMSYRIDPALAGLVSTTDAQYYGMNLGFYIHPGDIITRRAISISSYIYTILCTNPLTFAGLGDLGKFGVDEDDKNYRVLRIQAKDELRPRLERAIDQTIKGEDRLKSMIDYARNNPVDPYEAKIILTAFLRAYNISDKVIEQVLQRLNYEDQTTYGMAQATSYIARHGEFRNNATVRLRERLSTVAGASLRILDPEETAEKSLKWLKERLTEKTPDWLKDLLKKKKQK